MKLYNVGMVGFGFIGKVHAYGHLNIPLFYDQREFKSRITHVCTSRMETAEKGAAQVGAEHAVTDYREITENPEIDIVDICTPNHLHFDALMSAIRHNKHIYCDKPLTATVDEALKIREALKGYKGISQMTLQNRFFPVTLRAKQMIEEGLLGDILEFRGFYLHSGSADPKAPLKWKLSAEAGGGVVADLGSHILDLMNHLLGDFAALSAVTHIAYPERPSAEDPSRMVKVNAEDNMIVTVRLPNGACGIISASKIATGSEDEIGFEIYGSKGALKMVPMDLHHLYYYDAAAKSSPIGGVRGWTAIDCGQRYDKPAGFPTPKAPMGWLRGHMHCLYTFLDSVHKGKAQGPSIEQGIRIQILLDHVKESAESGKWIQL